MSNNKRVVVRHRDAMIHAILNMCSTRISQPLARSRLLAQHVHFLHEYMCYNRNLLKVRALITAPSREG